MAPINGMECKYWYTCSDVIFLSESNNDLILVYETVTYARVLKHNVYMHLFISRAVGDLE